MKLEAIKHQGERSDLTSRQVGEKSQTSITLVADQAGESQRQVQRYIRLTELIPELLDMVDEKKIAFNRPMSCLSSKKRNRWTCLDAMDSEQATPSLSQAQRLKKYSQEGHLTLDMMRVIMGEEKKSDLDKITFTSDTLRKYFPGVTRPSGCRRPSSSCWSSGSASASNSTTAEKGEPMRDISAREPERT